MPGGKMWVLPVRSAESGSSASESCCRSHLLRYFPQTVTRIWVSPASAWARL